jgi:hypothetical protein
MSTQFVQGQHPIEHEHEKRTVELAGTGATTEAIGAAAAMVLAIIGLAGALSMTMMAVATIVLGAAILLDAGTVGARYNRLVHESWEGEESSSLGEQLVGGVSAGALGGIAGIVLGILALLGIATMSLCSVALIVFGAALLFGSAVKARLATLSTARDGIPTATRRLIDEAVGLSAGGEVLVGIAAAVLGVLSLLNVSSLTLVLVGFLTVGAVVLLGASAIGARMFAVLRHSH